MTTVEPPANFPRAHLAHLESIGLVVLVRLQPELEYLFRHALVHAAAYSSLVKADRRRLHQAAGEALERLAPGGAPAAATLPILAHHFAEAGDQARALRYATLAGQAAAAGYANAEAIHHFTRAIDLARAPGGAPEPVAALYLQRGRVYELSAQDAAALANYAELEAWAVAGGHRRALLAALNARATIYVRPSAAANPALGRALAEQALGLARELGDPAGEARALWNLLQQASAQGQIGLALAHGDQALALTRAHDLRELQAYVLTDLVKVLFQAEQGERAIAVLAEAAGLWRELGTLNMLADNLSTASMISAMAGRYPAALAHSAEAAQIAHQIGNLWNQAYALYMVGTIHFEHGEFDAALAVGARAEQLARQAGFAEGENQALFDQAMIYGYLGDLPRALALVEQGRARLIELGGVASVWAPLELIVPMLYLWNSRPAAAQAAFALCQPCQDPAELARQFVLTQAVVAQIRVRLALRAGDAAAALTQAEAGAAALRRSNVHLFLPDTILLAAQAQRAAGDLAAAQVTLAAARAEALEIGSRRAGWEIEAERARLAAQRGDLAEAQAAHAAARATLDDLFAQLADPGLQAVFRRRSIVRAVLLARPDSYPEIQHDPPDA
ncbi:MAG: hypothetical protein IT317_20520 [Anaerolineales bacterium]|nr:hypothetical protein [Anaerolineales bacterium]